MATKTGKEALLLWCQKNTLGYRDVDVRDFRKSWRDGLAFCALLHKHNPDIIDFDKLDKNNRLQNLKLAFDLAEKHYDVPQLIDAEDIVDDPEPLSMMTYLSTFYKNISSKSKPTAKPVSPATAGVGGAPAATGAAPGAGRFGARSYSVAGTPTKMPTENIDPDCCARCFEKLLDYHPDGTTSPSDTIEAVTRKFHVQCFVCFGTCGKDMTKSLKCLNVNNYPYCETCGRQAFIGRIKPPALPIPRNSPLSQANSLKRGAPTPTATPTPARTNVQPQTAPTPVATTKTQTVTPTTPTTPTSTFTTGARSGSTGSGLVAKRASVFGGGQQTTTTQPTPVTQARFGSSTTTSPTSSSPTTGSSSGAASTTSSYAAVQAERQRKEEEERKRKQEAEEQEKKRKEELWAKRIEEERNQKAAAEREREQQRQAQQREQQEKQQQQRTLDANTKRQQELEAELERFREKLQQLERELSVKSNKERELMLELQREKADRQRKEESERQQRDREAREKSEREARERQREREEREKRDREDRERREREARDQRDKEARERQMESQRQQDIALIKQQTQNLHSEEIRKIENAYKQLIENEKKRFEEEQRAWRQREEQLLSRSNQYSGSESQLRNRLSELERELTMALESEKKRSEDLQRSWKEREEQLLKQLNQSSQSTSSKESELLDKIRTLETARATAQSTLSQKETELSKLQSEVQQLKQQRQPATTSTAGSALQQQQQQKKREMQRYFLDSAILLLDASRHTPHTASAPVIFRTLLEWRAFNRSNLAVVTGNVISALQHVILHRRNIEEQLYWLNTLQQLYDMSIKHLPPSAINHKSIYSIVKLNAPLNEFDTVKQETAQILLTLFPSRNDLQRGRFFFASEAPSTTSTSANNNGEVQDEAVFKFICAIVSLTTLCYGSILRIVFEMIDPLITRAMVGEFVNANSKMETFIPQNHTPLLLEPLTKLLGMFRGREINQKHTENIFGAILLHISHTIVNQLADETDGIACNICAGIQLKMSLNNIELWIDDQNLNHNTTTNLVQNNLNALREVSDILMVAKAILTPDVVTEICQDLELYATFTVLRVLKKYVSDDVDDRVPDALIVSLRAASQAQTKSRQSVAIRSNQAVAIAKMSTHSVPTYLTWSPTKDAPQESTVKLSVASTSSPARSRASTLAAIGTGALSEMQGMIEAQMLIDNGVQYCIPRAQQTVPSDFAEDAGFRFLFSAVTVPVARK